MDGFCSVRLIQPFFRLASTEESLRDLIVPEVRTMDLDARVPLRASHDAVAVASERIADPSLGLRLGHDFYFGCGGVFDYAVRSSSTVLESVKTAAKYSSLLASPLNISVEANGRQALVRFDDEVPWPRVIADFALAAWFRAHLSDELPRAANKEVWLPYAAPANTAEHERVFPGATLKFGAPFLGFAFDRTYEDTPMPVADPELHAVLCGRADALLSKHARSRSLTVAVRRIIGQDVRDGKMPTVESVSRKFHMSHRTVSRRLEQEGTSFARELDESRRELAVALVRQPDLSLSDVAYRLGFSHTESFFRAFKRWTGGTPRSYRVGRPEGSALPQSD
jgi:AraC-like DNA-binding protein